MPVICVYKKSGVVVADFQSNVVKDGTLIKNAVAAGLGVEEDFEEMEVSQEDFDQHIKAFKDSVLPQGKVVAQSGEEQLKQSIETKLGNFGLSKEEIDYIFASNR